MSDETPEEMIAERNAEANSEVMWYVATRKDSGAHFLLNENYIEMYEDEFERIREYDTMADAKEAFDFREKGERTKKIVKRKKAIKVSKIRGDIRKGDLDEDRVRAEVERQMAMRGSVDTQVADDINLLEEPEIVEHKATPKRNTRPTRAKLA